MRRWLPFEHRHDVARATPTRTLPVRRLFSLPNYFRKERATLNSPEVLVFRSLVIPPEERKLYGVNSL